MPRPKIVIANIFLFVAANYSFAQELSPPSRTVYRCDVNGKLVYSDSPCLGAKRIEIEPTRGLNKMSGVEKIGADVRRELQNEQMAEALKPIFGESAGQRAKRHYRATLPPEVQTKCSQLEGKLSATEAAEARATKGELQAVQVRLFGLRTQYRDLRC